MDVAIGAALGSNAAAETSDRLELDQLRIALHNLKPNHLLMPTFGAIICVMFARWVSVERLLLWYGALMLSVLPLAILSWQFLRSTLAPSQARRWSRWVTAAYALFTIEWSAMGFVLWVPGSDLNHMLLMMLLCCTLAGNGALVGASKPISITAYTVYGSAIVLMPLQAGGLLYIGLSGLAFFYTVYLALMSKQYFDTTRAMLLLRNDKNDLIAALARSKEQSDSARYRAENASLAKSQFLANMSHELRTPLNAIMGFSDLIQSRTFQNDIDRHVEYAQMIHSSGAHLLALINDILDLAKIEAGGLQLQERDLDFTRLANDCVQLMSARAAQNGLTLTSAIAPNLPLVRGDERALKQVLLNLASNAVKFTPKDGRVTVFAWRLTDGGLKFGVSDTGVGIAPQDHARVFENFGQGRHDIVVSDKGTGLGLPIVKGLVEAHGGHVTLKSAPDKGTTVTVFLPESRMIASPPIRAAS